MWNTVETKVMALRQLIQWSGHPVVVLLQETGVLPPRFVFHCLYWHTFTVVNSSSAGVTILERRDSQLHIGDFVHHPKGKAIVLELIYKCIPVQVVNVYMSAKGTTKEYRPLLQWLRAHVAPDSRLVLVGGDFQCNPGWLADCVSVNTEIALVLSEFVAHMAMLPFTHGMSGRTWASAQGFVGALDFFLSRRVSPEIGTVRVENESVFPSDHYPVRLCLHTLPAPVPPGNPTSRARLNLGTNVCKWQQETFADSCAGLRSLPPTATSETYQHFVNVVTTTVEAVFGPLSTPDAVPSLVSVAARVLHALLKAHRRWWLTAPLVRKVIAARKKVRQAWGVVGLERSLEVVPLARPGEGQKSCQVGLSSPPTKALHGAHRAHLCQWQTSPPRGTGCGGSRSIPCSSFAPHSSLH